MWCGGREDVHIEAYLQITRLTYFVLRRSRPLTGDKPSVLCYRFFPQSYVHISHSFHDSNQELNAACQRLGGSQVTPLAPPQLDDTCAAHDSNGPINSFVFSGCPRTPQLKTKTHKSVQAGRKDDLACVDLSWVFAMMVSRRAIQRTI